MTSKRCECSGFAWVFYILLSASVAIFVSGLQLKIDDLLILGIFCIGLSILFFFFSVRAVGCWSTLCLFTLEVKEDEWDVERHKGVALTQNFYHTFN